MLGSWEISSKSQSDDKSNVAFANLLFGYKLITMVRKSID